MRLSGFKDRGRVLKVGNVTRKLDERVEGVASYPEVLSLPLGEVWLCCGATFWSARSCEEGCLSRERLGLGVGNSEFLIGSIRVYLQLISN